MLKNAIILAFFIGANSFAAESSATSNKFTLKDADQATSQLLIPNQMLFKIFFQDKAFSIELPKEILKFDVQIVNVQGQSFYHKRNLQRKSSNELKIGQNLGLESGYYFLQMKYGEIQQSQKIWVEGSK